MLARTHGDEPVHARMQHFEHWVGHLTAREADVGFLVANKRIHCACHHVANVERDARHLALHDDHEFGQHARRERRQTRDANRPAFPLTQRTRIAQYAFHVVQ